MSGDLHHAISSIDEIIEDARNGRMFILVDAEDRENEGDLVIPASFATPEAVNFMAKFGRGLIFSFDFALGVLSLAGLRKSVSAVLSPLFMWKYCTLIQLSVSLFSAEASSWLGGGEIAIVCHCSGENTLINSLRLLKTSRFVNPLV